MTLKTCRVCRDSQAQHRPIVNPCGCTGTAKYIHSDCLLAEIEATGNKKCSLCNCEYCLKIGSTGVFSQEFWKYYSKIGSFINSTWVVASILVFLSVFWHYVKAFCSHFWEYPVNEYPELFIFQVLAIDIAVLLMLHGKYENNQLVFTYNEKYKGEYLLFCTELILYWKHLDEIRDSPRAYYEILLTVFLIVVTEIRKEFNYYQKKCQVNVPQNVHDKLAEDVIKMGEPRVFISLSDCHRLNGLSFPKKLRKIPQFCKDLISVCISKRNPRYIWIVRGPGTRFGDLLLGLGIDRSSTELYETSNQNPKPSWEEWYQIFGEQEQKKIPDKQIMWRIRTRSRNLLKHPESPEYQNLLKATHPVKVVPF